MVQYRVPFGSSLSLLCYTLLADVRSPWRLKFLWIANRGLDRSFTDLSVLIYRDGGLDRDSSYWMARIDIND